MGLEKHACNGNELQYQGLERQLNIRVRRGRGMVTNASTVTPNIIGTRGRTKMAKARTADRLLQEDRRPLAERRIDIAMVG